MCPKTKIQVPIHAVPSHTKSNWCRYFPATTHVQSTSWQRCKRQRTAQLWDKNQVRWKLYVQIKSSDKPPCHWHWTHWKCTSQSLPIYHRPDESSESRDTRSKATCDMKILSAEQRTGGAPPQQIPPRSEATFIPHFRGWSLLFNLMHWFSLWVLPCW